MKVVHAQRFNFNDWDVTANIDEEVQFHCPDCGQPVHVERTAEGATVGEARQAAREHWRKETGQ